MNTSIYIYLVIALERIQLALVIIIPETKKEFRLTLTVIRFLLTLVIPRQHL